MFGYIAVNKAEMKFKDFDTYHSYYCGLCRCLKEHYGRRGQLTLSYDMTFLVILLTGLYEPETALETVRCLTHPLHRHEARTNLYTEYAAAMNILLSYYKCRDDWKDEQKKKSYLAAKLLRADVQKIYREYPEKVSKIASALKRLSRLEKEDNTDLDKMSGIFGEIMAEIFAFRPDEWEQSLRKIGFFLGKFIYLMDAYEDIEKDEETGNYNPLRSLFGADVDFAGECRQLMTMMMAECSREFERLPILLHAEIIRNILYSGVWCRYTIVTARRENKEKQEKTQETITYV